MPNLPYILPTYTGSVVSDTRVLQHHARKSQAHAHTYARLSPTLMFSRRGRAPLFPILSIGLVRIKASSAPIPIAGFPN